MYSLSFLKRELEELMKDRVAFTAAYDCLRKRILEANESKVPRQPLLHEWSGSRAVCGSLELSIHAIERTIDEIQALIYKIEHGELSNMDEQESN